MAGHTNIAHNDVRLTAGKFGERRIHRASGANLRAIVLKNAPNDVAGLLFVIDHEHFDTSEINLERGFIDRISRRHIRHKLRVMAQRLTRKIDHEGCTEAGPATADPDAATVQLHKVLRDGQADTKPSVLARGRR